MAKRIDMGKFGVSKTPVVVAETPPEGMSFGKYSLPSKWIGEIIAVDKFGKTLFASYAPKAIFIAADHGLETVAGQVDYIKPLPRTYSEVLAQVNSLLAAKHTFQTVVIDTINAVESMLQVERHVTTGKEYMEVTEEMKNFRQTLQRLYTERDMNILLTCHCKVKHHIEPTGVEYDRYDPALSPSVDAVYSRWVHFKLFGHYEVFSKDGKIAVGGDRVIETQSNSAWSAGSRYDLPPQMPLDGKAFFDLLSDTIKKKQIKSEGMAIIQKVADTLIEPVPTMVLDEEEIPF